jgi:hypothetical protein
MSETRKPRRRWFQYSLRSLLLVMFLASLGMSWVAVRMKRAREEREAVEEIKRFGGYVRYDYEEKYSFESQHSKTPLPVPGPPGPAWLRNLLGEDFFATVAYVGFSTASNNASLEHLKGLTQLKKLDLQCSQITDAGLEHLTGLSRLETLDLYDTRITDTGLERLKGMANLQTLSLGRTKVTDTGLERLKEMGQLTELDLYETRVTDAGLEHLKGLTQLQTLGLDKTRVTDAGLERLKGLTQLRWLRLSVPNVTPKGVERLQQSLPQCQFMVGYGFVPPSIPN